MKKIIIRTITGIVYVAVLVAATECGPYVFLAVFGCLLALGLYEAIQICGKDNPASALTTAIDIAGGLAIFAAAFFHFSSPNHCGESPLWCAIGYSMVRCIVQLYQKGHGGAIHSLGASLVPMFVVTLPLAMLCKLYFYGEYGHTTLLACLIFIWTNDTGAFCIGSLIGKRRLFERISPKKSWEGFFGGLFFTIIAALIIAAYFHQHFAMLSLAQWVGMAAVVSVFATWGDLIESMLKRDSGKKDSGKLLPGHGGVLDRIDSLLTVAPAALFYLILVIG